jgi:hypothetical protein
VTSQDSFHGDLKIRASVCNSVVFSSRIPQSLRGTEKATNCTRKSFWPKRFALQMIIPD